MHVGDDECRRHRRHLPHLEVAGATYFVTTILRRPPAVDLTAPAFAEVVIQALRHRDGDTYLLFDYTVMPEHVHFIIKPLGPDGYAVPLGAVVGPLKGWAAYSINRLTRRSGTLWQDENFERIVRNRADYREIAKYILENAQRRGLVSHPVDWPWWGMGSGGATL